MKFIKLLIGLVALAGLALLASFILFVRIEPSEIGVRQSMWGDSGVGNEDFTAGFHLGISQVHKWHRLDRRTHFLTFSQEESQSGYSRLYQNAQEAPPLEIRTRDNNPVSVDVTVTYRIIEGEGHMIVSEGQKTNYRERVASKVRGVLREELSRLVPSEFVNTETRLTLVTEILPILQTSLAEYHVVPEALLIRAVRFLETYEAKLQETQLTSQLTERARAKSKVEAAEMATGTISKETEALEKKTIAEWDKKLQEASSNNDVLIAQILAEANIYDNKTRPGADATYESLVADGQLAVDKAEALRDELRNAALDSAGGRILQARNAAENLNFESVTLNSNDPSVPSVIEIDKLVDLLIGKEE
jgi:regulator of protease activity HflC (stomatin/prohibitin superfamily)